MSWLIPLIGVALMLLVGSKLSPENDGLAVAAGFVKLLFWGILWLAAVAAFLLFIGWAFTQLSA